MLEKSKVSDVTEVEGYKITEHLKDRWVNDLQPLLNSLITGDWNAALDPGLTIYTASNQQMARLVAAYVCGFIDPSLPYGTGLFDQLNRLRPTVAIETPCVEWDEALGKWMVWLRLRGPIEAYPNQYEVGGSGWNGLPEIFEDVASRTFQKKFGVPVSVQTILWDSSFLNQEERGSYFHIVVPVKFELRPEVRGIDIVRVPVDNLPENTVAHHRDYIIPAAVSYAKNQSLFEAGLFMMRLALGKEQLAENGKAANQDAARHAIAVALKLKEPGTPMGTEMYNAYSPHATNVSCEGVCLRQGPVSGEVEVFLTTHPFYPGKLVGLGKVAQAGEEYTNTLERLRNGEFGVPTTFEYVGERHFPNDPRGDFLCRMYLAEPEGDPKAPGKWYRAEPLQENTQYAHAIMIPIVVAAFKKKHNL